MPERTLVASPDTKTLIKASISTLFDHFTIYRSDNNLPSKSPTLTAVPSRKRDEISSVGYNATVLPPASFENQSLNYVILPLGDLDAGNYSISLLGNEAFQSFVVVDGDGEQYGEMNGSLSNGNQTLDFVLTGDAGGVGLAVYTENKSLNVTWYFNGTTNSTAASSASKRIQHPDLLLWALLGGVVFSGLSQMM